MQISTVPAPLVKALLDAAQRKGCDRAALLSTVNVGEEMLAGSRARVPSSVYSQLTELITEELQDEYCGLAGTRAKPGTFAMMCYACIHCPSLGSFLQRTTEYHGIVSDSSNIELQLDSEVARYIYTPLDNKADPDHLLTMSLLAIAHRLASWLVGQNIPLVRVNLAHPRPDHAASYNMLFRCPVKFDQAENSIVLSAKYLEMPTRQTEQTLESFLNTAGPQLMASPDTSDSHAARVSKLIAEAVNQDFPDFNWVASQLHTTAATLRRRLRSEGTSYQQLKDDLRRDTAIYNLNRGVLSIEEVAQSVGFAEPTSFFRAFKRWTGVTPRVYILREKDLNPSD